MNSSQIVDEQYTSPFVASRRCRGSKPANSGREIAYVVVAKPMASLEF